MSWFFIALFAPALYAATNHVDKYLLQKYFKAGEVGSLVLFSSLFSVFALPVIYLIQPAVLAIGYSNALVLIFSGIIVVISLILYFYALERDEASVVVPFYETIPIFSFFLGYFILGETLSFLEIFACLMIIAGVIILSLDISGEKIKIKYKVIALMLGASLLFAVNGAIFKLIAINAGFWTSAFWVFAGKMICGIFIYLFIRSYREQFQRVLRINKFSVLLLNSLNETIYILAEGIMYFATLLAPIALVYTVGSLQQLFVFIFGIIITVFFPKLGRESLEKRILVQKIAAIVFIIAGSYILKKSGM